MPARRSRRRPRTGMDVRSINAGEVRHPLFGIRSHWYPTTVKAGFVDRAADKTRREVRKQVLAAIDRATQQLRARH